MSKRRPLIPTRAQIALGALALLLLGSWIFRIPLSESLLRARLSAVGIPVANVEVTSLTPWRIHVRHLQLADGARLRRGEAQVEWPGLFSPRLARISLTGLDLELGPSSAGLGWAGLSPSETAVIASHPDLARSARLPEIQIRDAVAKVIAPDNMTIAEVIAPSISFVPTRVRAGENMEGSTRMAVAVNADLAIPKLRAHGWEVTDAGLKISGRIENRDGQLYYRPEDCDQAKLKVLKKEQISVSGPLAACLKAGGEGVAVAIHHDGGFALDMMVEPERAEIQLDVAALPPLAIQLERGLLSLQFSQKPEGSLVGSMTLRELNLTQTAAGFSLDGAEVSATTEAGEAWSFVFGTRALRHHAALPAFHPLIIEGQGQWAPDTLTAEAEFRQAIPGLGGRFHLHRDNVTGEGEAGFDLSPLEFREGSLGVSDVSPLLAQHVTRLTGDFHASGRILFNDAWATPLQVTGTGNNLVVAMPQSTSKETMVADFGRSRFSISLPPLSPAKGWASVDVAAGALRLGDTDPRELTATIDFPSLWPLTCSRAYQPATKTTNGEDEVTATIVTCLLEALAIAP